MAGHSKWANIKRQKAVVDAKKGKVFTKYSREIIVAARSGVPDPAGNFQLRSAIEKAKAAGMPNENIDRAIAKGAGTLNGGGDDYEAIRYEGYGPGGVAILIEALTDNRNRTAADLRVAFSKNGGNLGELGCVSWMFTHRGVVTLGGMKNGEALNEDELLEASLDAEAESYELIDSGEAVVAEVFTEVSNLEGLSQALKGRGYEVAATELRWIAGNETAVTDLDQARRVIKLMNVLEDLDDVQNVTANFDIAEALLVEAMV